MRLTTVPNICLLFSGFSNVCHSACVWPTALKRDCITNFDMLFHVMGFISLVDANNFSSRHICIRSILYMYMCVSCILNPTHLSDVTLSKFCLDAIALFKHSWSHKEANKMKAECHVLYRYGVHVAGRPFGTFDVFSYVFWEWYKHAYEEWSNYRVKKWNIESNHRHPHTVHST